MLKNSLLASSTLCSAASLSLLLLASPAMAQTTPAAAQPAAAQPADDAAAPDVVVTGSRIRRPSLDSPVPVTTLQGEEFFHTASTSVGDVLNDLPALTSTFSQSNSTRFLGTSGLSLLDLRGLGPQRTLVLVNGRRHVAGDILSEATSPDVNTIPADLIERVDIVTLWLRRCRRCRQLCPQGPLQRPANARAKRHQPIWRRAVVVRQPASWQKFRRRPRQYRG
jgi:outer membrane receptor protein involved in Fe transport